MKLSNINTKRNRQRETNTIPRSILNVSTHNDERDIDIAFQEEFDTLSVITLDNNEKVPNKPLTRMISRTTIPRPTKAKVNEIIKQRIKTTIDLKQDTKASKDKKTSDTQMTLTTPEKNKTAFQKAQDPFKESAPGKKTDSKVNISETPAVTKELELKVPKENDTEKSAKKKEETTMENEKIKPATCAIEAVIEQEQQQVNDVEKVPAEVTNPQLPSKAARPQKRWISPAQKRSKNLVDFWTRKNTKK
jgi:hypothetical protein